MRITKTGIGYIDRLSLPGGLLDAVYVRVVAPHEGALRGADRRIVAAAHHERLDGTGYPLRLDAAHIGRETRIITACDFYDALTSARPYRGALPVEEAFRIMDEAVGSALDGACVEALKRSVG